jgi:endonuclease/exonuclease/phosphatase family metal-dependent hydrolase
MSALPAAGRRGPWRPGVSLPCPAQLRWLLNALLAALVSACGLPPPEPVAPGQPPLRVLTFNVGSDGDSVTDAGGDSGSGFDAERAAIADRWYGNGLSWLPGIEAVRRFLSLADADIVALQEIFPAAQCQQIPERWHAGFICEDWQPGAPDVAQRILGSGYQVACHRDKPDKCLAVHRRLGQLSGCDAAGCAPLRGVEIEGCGRGSRQGLAIIALRGGGELAVGHVHGRSGAKLRDARCRERQFSTLLGDEGVLHPPTARAIVLGDFNTDPARVRWLDPSAQLLADAGRRPGGFRFLSRTGVFARPTFLSFLNIDHVLARGYGGHCRAGGRDPELAAPAELGHLDHSPLLCELWPLPPAPAQLASGQAPATPPAGEIPFASRYSTRPPSSAD